MHPRCSLNGRRKDDGQSLLETAISMPLLLGVAFNIISFA
jgi:Flp pilus assembly protein TadG